MFDIFESIIIVDCATPVACVWSVRESPAGCSLFISEHIFRIEVLRPHPETNEKVLRTIGFQDFEPVPPVGFEPTTHDLKGRCSNR